jgi:hypothetical protein
LRGRAPASYCPSVLLARPRPHCFRPMFRPRCERRRLSKSICYRKSSSVVMGCHLIPISRARAHLPFIPWLLTRNVNGFGFPASQPPMEMLYMYHLCVGCCLVEGLPTTPRTKVRKRNSIIAKAFRVCKTLNLTYNTQNSVE